MSNVFDRLKRALAHRYAVVQEVGSGGMGTVYLAEDLKLERKVALKVLRPELAATLGPERFLREIKLTAQLQHPHILPVHDSGEADGFLYYVMPYVDGESLRERMDREGQLPIDDAVRIASEVADALQSAHVHGVIHRDIKPENILLGEGGAMVADFGIALALSHAGGERLTSAGVGLGTPHYTSPEQAGGDPDLDGRCDVYALGCTLYEMLAGEPPYSGGTAQSTLIKHLVDPIPPVRRIRDTVPEHVGAALSRALAKSRADRFRTAGEFSAALRAPGIEGRRRPRARAFGAAAVAVLGVAAASLLLRPGPEEEMAVSRNTVAVFPFSVRGSEDIAYLREGMVDLLSAKLDGAGELRSVDPHALLSLVQQTGGDVDLASAGALAERAGAGLYVLGSVVELGGRLQLQGSLYDVREGGVPIGQASDEGVTAELFELVDGLVAGLLAERYGDAGLRLSQLAARTSSSLDALKAYLEGEGALRAGRWDEARRAFARAAEADTTFALANYRLATLAGWGSGEPPPPISRGASDRAARHLEGLAPRDRQLIEAFVTYERDISAAELLYRDLVNRYPDEVEGWFWLGHLLFGFNPPRGRPMAGAREPLERALALDPTHNRALVHLMEIAALEQRYTEFDSLLARMDPEATFATWARATPAAVRGDSTLRASVHEELERVSDVDLVATAVHAAFLLHDVGEVEPLAELLTRPERAPATRARGHALLATLAMARGQRREALGRLAKAEDLDGSSFIEHRAMLATLPFIEVEESELAAVRDALRRWSPSAPPGSTNAHAWSRHPQLRAYLLGHVSARLGDHGAALVYADSVERVASAGADRDDPVAQDLANGVRAHVAWRRGELTEALSRLERVPHRLRASDGHLYMWRPFFSQLLERFLHGEILLALGRDREALPWYESFVAHDGYGVLYHAPAARRQGEIAERLGEPDAAARHYARFLEHWEDADPELEPPVRAIARRLDELRAGGT